MKVSDLGVVDYRKAYQHQMTCVHDVINGGVSQLILCEHPAVLTLGRLADRDHLLLSEKELKQRNIDVITIDRGGEVTLHAPGQLIVYPIINLNNFDKDLHKYMYMLEEVAIELLDEFDIVSGRNKKNTGVWISQKKIASIGIGVKKWVTYHGIGINVNTDLNLFQCIRPCGLAIEMTSIKNVKNHEIDINLLKMHVIQKFNNVFQTNFVKESE